MPKTTKYPHIASTALTERTFNYFIADVERLNLSKAAWLRLIINLFYQDNGTNNCEEYLLYATKEEALTLIEQGYELRKDDTYE